MLSGAVFVAPNVRFEPACPRRPTRAWRPPVPRFLIRGAERGGYVPARRGGQRPRGIRCQSGSVSYTSLFVSRTTCVPSARMTKISLDLLRP
jgi:hypothetical protein